MQRSVGLLALFLGFVCAYEIDAQSAPVFTPPSGLEHMELPVPADNPLTAAGIKPGEQLFFDKRLSANGKMSCESCHMPEKGWADGQRFSKRFDGSLNTVHTPTLFGVAYSTELGWDGASEGLEAVILDVWRTQMGADPEQVSRRLASVSGYRTAFERDMGGPPTPVRVVRALATFVRTIHAGDTPWDRQPKDDASLAKSESGQGFQVFSRVAICTLCHLPPLYSDTLFHNVGVGFDKNNPDLERGQALADAAARDRKPAPADTETFKGAYKTPSLRGLALTAPYFHDGRAATLEEAADFMLQGGIDNPHRDDKLREWPVTPKQRRQLLAFLRSLTPASAVYRRPRLP